MSLTLDQVYVLAHLSPHSPELMPIPMRHLLASSAVAGLLVLLPVGDANAQDNRNTWGWGTAGGVVLSFIAIAAAGGAVVGSSTTSWLLLQRKGKRDDAVNEKLENVLNDINRLTSAEAELNSSIKILDTKLNGVNELTSTLEKKIDNLRNENEALNDLEQEQEKFQELLRKCEDEKGSLNKEKIGLQKILKDQESNIDKQWKIMKDNCKEDEKKNQKINPINYLKLIKSSKSVSCYDCLNAIKKLCPNSLEILPEADKSAKDHEKFTNIDQLFELLWKLGTDFQERMRPEGSRSSEIAQAVFSKGQYAPYSSKENKGGKHEPASVQYKGRTIKMHEHLKIGDDERGAPENSCLRVHFSWDVESKKVLIGHCGKHL